MKRILAIFYFFTIPFFSFSLSLEETKKEIENNPLLPEAEKIREIASLYRLMGNWQESFNLLKKSIENSYINEWLLQDYSALAETLDKEKEAYQTASYLLENPSNETKMYGTLLKGLLDIKESPEEVLEDLKNFSSQYKEEKINPLFLILLSNAYASLGNKERSDYFKSLWVQLFPNFYEWNNYSQILEEERRKNSLIQVGSFKKESESLSTFVNRLQKLGLSPIKEIEQDQIKVRIITNDLNEAKKILNKENIPFFIVREAETETISHVSFQGGKSTLQVGIFSNINSAENQRKKLEEDNFPGIRIVYQEDKELFYLFLETDNPYNKLKELKDKGYDAFIKNLE